MTSIIDRPPDGHKVSAASDITAELGAVAEPRMVEAVDPILLYHPDAYRVDREDIKGRRAAGDSFLRAFLAQASGPEVYALCQSRQHFNAFSEAVAGAGRRLVAKPVFRRDVATMRARSLVHLPHPSLSSEARVRSFLGDDAYALTGVTHTIASRRVLDDVADFVVAPTMSWDALICTSRAVHTAVSIVLKSVEDDLRSRLGATRFSRPLLPIIPLGIHTGQFSRRDADRMRWRRKLGIGDDVVAVLFLGRLSVHGKAAPFQIAQAIERATRSDGRRYAMIWAGPFSNDFQRKVFMETAKAMAPTVPFHHVDALDPEIGSIWSAADIFCSLSDNVQESFGLAIVEAMAAGLPVIASNWDGYRDTVQHGVTGILVDSYMPAVSLADTAYRYINGEDSYDRYIGGLSQFCMVDVAQTAHWISRLGAEPELRRKLGVAAKRAARSSFDWAVVLLRYRELWAEQRERLLRARAGKAPTRSTTWQSCDPASSFVVFPSHHVGSATLIRRGPHYQSWNAVMKMPGIMVNPYVLLQTSELQALRAAFSEDRTQTVEALVGSFSMHVRANVLRSLHWLIKIGLLGIVHQKS